MNEQPYDSTADTLLHIRRVQSLLHDISTALLYRAQIHDQSKLEEPEKSIFDKYTPLLKTMAYGSPEYLSCLRGMKPALDHHYQACSHHPEHFGENGINGMSLLDLVEMMCDWLAATERMKDGGDIQKSIEINRVRFKIDDQLTQILWNTVKELNW